MNIMLKLLNYCITHDRDMHCTFLVPESLLRAY